VVFLRFPLGGRTVPRIGLILTAINAFFASSTIVFLIAWAQRDDYEALGRNFLSYVLVQTHLATENVLAAWYSSMLLLAVAVCAAAAYSIRTPSDDVWTPPWLRPGWLVIAAVFALLSFDEIGSFHERIGAALSFGAVRGWVYVLALPILAVAAYILAFAWMQMRRVPLTFRFIAIGTAFYLLDPILEQVEMSLIHGAGADPDSWARFAHDTLLVLEEGVLELFGTLSFLMGLLVWLREAALHTPAHTLTWRVDADRAARIGGMAALAAALGVPLSALMVRVLPATDTGIPMNWFPAAAAFLLVLVATGVGATKAETIYPSRELATVSAILALVISAYFGAGIHGYTTWGSFDMLRQLLQTALAVGFAVVCVLMSRKPTGEHIGALLVAAVLMACAINVSGPHAALSAALAAVACGTGIASQALIPNPQPSVPAQSAPRISQRSGNAGRPTVA
jgi:hypothetical protein